ncbi:hypothetical protein [Thalassospira povalilytica]|uniref:hypothetical protein n=1 Tax=Thalassospira povalilytica TaxID=732237 RepID=UPI003AA99469
MGYQNVFKFKASKWYGHLRGTWAVKDSAVQDFINISSKEISRGLISPSAENDVYDESMEYRLWAEYKDRSRNSISEDNVSYTFYIVERAVDPLVNEGSIIVNFGAMYAFPESRLATRHPKAKFFSIDRSEKIKTLNQKEFDLDNLYFEAKDIFSFLEDFSGNIDILIHSKVLMFLYPGFASKLYKIAQEKGIKHILGIEFGGYSYESGSYFNFDGNVEKDSVVLRPPFFAHNYPKIAKDNGYSVVSSSLNICPMKKKHQKDAHLYVMRADLNKK